MGKEPEQSSKQGVELPVSFLSGHWFGWLPRGPRTGYRVGQGFKEAKLHLWNSAKATEMLGAKMDHAHALTGTLLSLGVQYGH